MNRLAYLLMIAALVIGYIMTILWLWHSAGCSVHMPC